MTFCKNQHFNDAESKFCSICGDALTPVLPTQNQSISNFDNESSTKEKKSNKTFKILIGFLVAIVGASVFVYFRLQSVEQGALESVETACQEWNRFIAQDIESPLYEHNTFGNLLTMSANLQYAEEYGSPDRSAAIGGIRKIVDEINNELFAYQLQRDLDEITGDNDSEIMFDEIVGLMFIVDTWCDAQ